MNPDVLITIIFAGTVTLAATCIGLMILLAARRGHTDE
jgi:hypothetical protein